MFRGMLITSDFLFHVFRSAFDWVEGCPCHTHLDWEMVEAYVRSRWGACPLRGCRVDEIAAGDFLEFVRELLVTNAVDLLLALPAELDDVQRGKCMRVFEKGRSMILLEMTIKITPLMVPPYSIGGIAHYCRDKAMRVLRLCLECDSMHQQLVELRTTHLEASTSVLMGDDIHEHPEFALFLGRYKFCSAAEREVEVGHAKINRRTATARNRTEAYDSLAVRMPGFRRVLDAPCGVEAIADFLQAARSPRDACIALGFKYHPSLVSLTHPWDKMYRKTIYRAD